MPSSEPEGNSHIRLPISPNTSMPKSGAPGFATTTPARPASPMEMQVPDLARRSVVTVRTETSPFSIRGQVNGVRNTRLVGLKVVRVSCGRIGDLYKGASDRAILPPFNILVADTIHYSVDDLVLAMAGSVTLSCPVSTWPAMWRWKAGSAGTSTTRSYQP
jgi:hypothetical protein